MERKKGGWSAKLLPTTLVIKVQIVVF